MKHHTRVVAIAVAVATSLGTTTFTGCTPNTPPPSRCNQGIGVIWSSQYDPTTHIEFWDPAGKQGTITAEVQGVIPVAATTTGTRGFASNGNIRHDKSAITLIDRSRCTAEVHPLAEIGTLAATPTRNGMVVAYDGGRKWLDSYSVRGEKTATLDLNELGPSAIIDSDHGLLVAATEFRAESMPPQGPIHLLRLGPDQKKIVNDINLTKKLHLPPIEGSIHEMATIGDDVFLALAFMENQFTTPSFFEARRSLTVVNLPTGNVTEIQLEKDMPYQVLEHQGKIYVAHTFLNPGVRPFDQYRYISRVDPHTKKVETFDVGPNLKAIAFDNTQLYVLHSDGTGPDTLDVIDPTTMKPLTTHNLPKPTGTHYYIAGIGLGNPPA